MKAKRQTTKGSVVEMSSEDARARVGGATPRARGSKKGKQVPSSSRACAGESARVLAHEQVAERAKAIWEQRGCVPGEDEHNWLEAERQLRQESGF
jgi:hypothetical protein